MSERDEKEQLDQELPANEPSAEGQAEIEIDEQVKSEIDLLKNEQEPIASREAEHPTEQTAAPKSGATALVVPWIITAIAVVALLVILVRNPTNGVMNETVGEMNGASFSTSDLYTEMTSTMAEGQLASILDSIMTLELIELEAQDAGITLSEADLEAELETIKKNFGSDEEFTSALQQNGMTLDSLKEQITTQLKLRKIFEKHNPVTEDDLKSYYDSNNEAFATSPKQVQASHILLETQEEAEAVLADLKSGKDFAAAAKEKSIDTYSKEEGGVLPLFGRGEMNSGFETAAFALAKGEMSEVVQAESGFHIIKVTDIVEPVVPAYEEIKADVKLYYYDEKISLEGQAWMEKAKNDRGYKNHISEKAAEASPSAE